MFSWFKKLFAKPEAPTPTPAGPPPGVTDPPKSPAEPRLAPGNPGKGHSLRLAVQGPAGQRSEEIDLAKIFAQILTQKGHTISRAGALVQDEETGLQFLPSIVSFQPGDDLSMQMCTTVEIRHPTRLPIPFFEYQHSIGATGEIAVTRGFEGWADLDLPVILDALEEQMETCTAMELTLPDGRRRRVILGPVSLMKPGAERVWAEEPEPGSAVPHPPACPCCMFTNAGQAFKHFMESDRFHALRLLALRNAEGAPSADCRVNGEEYDEGKAALTAYAARWPFTGVEMWKQYVIIQDHPATE